MKKWLTHVACLLVGVGVGMQAQKAIPGAAVLGQAIVEEFTGGPQVVNPSVAMPVGQALVPLQPSKGSE